MDTYEADIAAINELYEQYVLAGTTGDLDLFMTLWMDNAIRMVQDTPAIIGREPIRAHFRAPFEQVKIDISIYGETEVEVAGDWGFSLGNFKITYTPKEQGPKTYFDGKWLDILKRQADGSWKIYCDCITFNEPPKVF